MSLSRRGFLTSLAQMTAGAAAAKFEGVAGLIDAVAGSGSAGRASALHALLVRRSEILVSSADGLNMQDLWSKASDDMLVVKYNHLAPVKYDVSLLTPPEARAFEDEMVTLQSQYAGHYKRLEDEVTRIDDTLRQYPKEVAKLIEPDERYQAMVDGMGHSRASRLAQLPERPLADIDAGVVQDARAIIDGSRPTLLSSQKEQFTEVAGNVNKITTEIAEVMHAPKPKKWQEKRREALKNYVSELLNELAGESEVRIESALTKGYGPDNWVITTQMRQNEIGKEQDQALTERIVEIMEILEKAYPERFTGDAEPLIAHSRPLQPGYGEHDCERLIIKGPEWSLREVLKSAERLNLKMRNAENNEARLAR